MNVDVKVSYSDFAIFNHKVDLYVQFLKDSIDSYMSILNSIVQNGINDEKITKSISILKSNIKVISDNLVSNVSNISKVLYEFAEKVEKNDNFVYNDDDMSSLLSTLSMFL